MVAPLDARTFAGLVAFVARAISGLLPLPLLTGAADTKTGVIEDGFMDWKDVDT